VKKLLDLLPYFQITIWAGEIHHNLLPSIHSRVPENAILRAEDTPSNPVESTALV
jgi:hypothetical protein